MSECTKCPFCESSSLESASEKARIPAIIRKFKSQSFTVWRCRECGSLHSRETVDLPAYYAAYPFVKQELDFFTRRAFQNRLRQLVREGLKPSNTILDFGCNNGGFVTYLKSQGFTDVEGYDRFVEAFHRPELLKRKYDVIVAQDVIEHAEDPAEMFSTLVGCLKNGGLLCIGTPCADRIRLDGFEPFAVSLHQPYHRHIFSSQALLAEARKHGLNPQSFYRRHAGESKFPVLNILAMHEYVRFAGGDLEAGFEPIRLSVFLRHPQLFFYVFFGYFFCRQSEMSAYFRRLPTLPAAKPAPLRKAAVNFEPPNAEL